MLVVQKDESDANMRQKRDLMGMQDPGKRILVQDEIQRRPLPRIGGVD